MNMEEGKGFQEVFDESIEEALRQVVELNEVDLVIGIPFYDEKELLPKVLKIVDEGLAGLQEQRKSLIVCVGDPAGVETLESIRQMTLSAPHLEFLMKPGSSGRGVSIRAILEVAHKLDADAIILAADLAREDGRGLQPDWIRRLLEPIRKEYDFALVSFQRHYFNDLLGNLFVAPLLETFYGYNIKSALSGVYAISHDLVEDFCIDIKFWNDITRKHGIDPWLISRAICWNKNICEVQLGSRAEKLSLEKLNGIFKETARSLFECIRLDVGHCSGNRAVIKTLDIYDSVIRDVPDRKKYSSSEIALFRDNYIRQKNLYGSVGQDFLYEEIGDITSVRDKELNIGAKIWAEMTYRLLFRYWFIPSVSQEDILNALVFAFNGRVDNFIDHIRFSEEEIESRVEAEKQKKEFFRLRDLFLLMWEQKDVEMMPPLNPANFLEFIPGVPTILHKKLQGKGGKVVSSEEMMGRLQSRYQCAFSIFLQEGLGTSETADSSIIIGSMKKFLVELESTMDWLLPGDPYTVEGAKKIIEALIQLFPSPLTFSVKDEVLRNVLLRFPPLNVMMEAGCKTPRELLKKMDVREAVSLANLVEGSKYAERCLRWMLDILRPDGMGEVEIKPIVLSGKVLGGKVKLSNIADFNKISSQIVIKPLEKGLAGEYPKLRLVLFVSRHIAMAKNYGMIWKNYAKERKNLGRKIRNSLAGNYDTIAFSAHKVFENYHHRALIKQFEELSLRLTAGGQHEQARLIKIMCEGYGLSQVLADGTFMPCSAWSWASYSYKGGKGVPPPLFSHVEETWFNRDFLKEIYEELGYNPDEILDIVIQLIGEDRGSENLLNVLLGIKSKDVTVVVQDSQDYPPAAPLLRFAGNPLLHPIKEHPWESKYVLNAAAFRIKDRVYLLYRAHGDDDVSRIGLAITDGYNVLERLPEPVFAPQGGTEKKGVEDPRVVIIDNIIRMLYIAFDGVTAQVAAAHISVEDFINRRFDKWVRDGLVFQDIWDKDAILFPEKIQGKYIIYHRIDPSVWMLSLNTIALPVPKTGHSIILGPRSGWMWDSLKVGAGSQPIKTKYGWLLIYHGVDRNRVYRLGVILVDLTDPQRLLYRSPNPVLSPETEYEIGKKGECWVPNVVFTCGAVPAEDKEELDADDEILVYYGAADTHICLATGRVGDLIPESIRREAE